MDIRQLSLGLAVLSTALITGLYYAYSCSVNPGLARVSDRAYIEAMQAINRAIQNPVFFFSFMGTLIFLPAAAWLSYRESPLRCYVLVAASLIYIIASFGVTVFGNVPLNDMLDKVQTAEAPAAALKAARAAFEPGWNRLHTIRTWASFVTLLLGIAACLIPAPRP